MAARTYAVESAVYRIAGLLDRSLSELNLDGDPGPDVTAVLAEHAIECSIAKVFASEALADVADQGVQIHGGYGFMHGYAVERAYRDNRINRIFEGTNEINRLLIPQTLLRRLRRGETPAYDGKILTQGMTASGAVTTSESLEGERWVVDIVRNLFWHLLGLARARYGDQIDEEQELLVALADISIGLFVIESAVVRATRAMEAQEATAAIHRDLAKSVAANQIPTIAEAIRRAIYRVADTREGGSTLVQLAAIESVGGFDRIERDRRIAARVIQAEGWPV
jgi:hypothetical protein